jgi:hypothetical protein
VVLRDVQQHRHVVELTRLLFRVAECTARRSFVAPDEQEVEAALHRADVGHALEYRLALDLERGLQRGDEVDRRVRGDRGRTHGEHRDDGCPELQVRRQGAVPWHPTVPRR